MSNQHIDFLPKGSVIMWYGNSTEVPNGWAICDGHNNSKFGGNVPDLRRRFVVGADSDDSNQIYGKGKTGGAETVALNTSQMPSHNHGGKAKETDIVNGGNSREKDYLVMHPDTYNRDFDDGDYTGYDRKRGDAKTLSWCIKFKHEHELEINHTGGNQAHENRPPFFALYYIIKVTDSIQ